MKPKKQIKNIAAQAFPSQFERLRPESSKAGGVKARSGAQERRNAIYYCIAELFKAQHPECDCYGEVPGCEILTTDVHHRAGREGLLLFDVRKFMAVCRPCHDWIHAHPEEAGKRGFMEARK